jgi:hypothetical protein
MAGCLEKRESTIVYLLVQYNFYMFYIIFFLLLL